MQQTYPFFSLSPCSEFPKGIRAQKTSPCSPENTENKATSQKKRGQIHPGSRKNVMDEVMRPHHGAPHLPARPSETASLPPPIRMILAHTLLRTMKKHMFLRHRAPASGTGDLPEHDGASPPGRCRLCLPQHAPYSPFRARNTRYKNAAGRVQPELCPAASATNDKKRFFACISPDRRPAFR